MFEIFFLVILPVFLIIWCFGIKFYLLGSLVSMILIHIRVNTSKSEETKEFVNEAGLPFILVASGILSWELVIVSIFDLIRGNW